MTLCRPVRLLKSAGYHVKWLGKNDALSKAAFNLSVTSWENDIGYDSGHNMFAYGEAGYWSMLSDGRGAKHANDTSQGDLLAVTKAVHFMQHDPPEPFVLFLATRGAHPPYGAPPEYTHKWTLDQVKQHVKLRPAQLKIKMCQPPPLIRLQ